MGAPAATLQEGPLGLQGWHSLNGITMNDLTPGHWPRVFLTSITGLRDRADSADNRELNTGRVGETVYPSLQGGKTLVYTGILQAKDPVSLEVARSSLLYATYTEDVLPMLFTPPPARGGVAFFTPVRVLACTIDDDFTYIPTSMPSPWQRAFILTVRMSQPVFYQTTVQSVSETGGSVTAENYGTAPTEPALVIAVAAGDDVSVTNASIGGMTIAFKALPVYGDLIIDFIQRTALIGAVDAMPFMDDVATTWWDEGVPGLASGVNDLTRTGGSAMSVVYYNSVA